ncbi:hypothetical protein [Frigidibacter sp. MR17.24]|uniref:hypothetical protein n=1 Tax=Frigidibacter sp. MR17.24 TaxID=3127345 RepID=UPI00301303BF
MIRPGRGYTVATFAWSYTVTLALSTAGTRDFTVTGLPWAIPGRRYSIEPLSGLPAGHVIGNCWCVTNGQIVMRVICPAIAIGTVINVSLTAAILA